MRFLYAVSALTRLSFRAANKGPWHRVASMERMKMVVQVLALCTGDAGVDKKNSVRCYFK
jgi:hypothetical protein